MPYSPISSGSYDSYGRYDRRPPSGGLDYDFEGRLRDAFRRSRSVGTLDAGARRAMVDELRSIWSYLSRPPAGVPSGAWGGRRGPSAPQVGLPLWGRYGQGDAKPANPGVNEASSSATDVSGVDSSLSGPSRAKQPGFGEATQKGAAAFKDLAKSVDFKGFVTGLMDNVFDAIIDSNKKQMEQFKSLLEAVQKSASAYGQENISEDEAKMYLRTSYPNAFNPNLPELSFQADLDDDDKPDFKALLGDQAPQANEVESDEGIQKLLVSARTELARQKQQTLATMVLMGINRIIVTDGFINAKVVFDVAMEDSSSAETKGKLSKKKGATSSGGKFANIGGTAQQVGQTARFNVSTLDVNTLDESESKINAKAQLTGEVRLNFKSETFPLEKIADNQGMALLGDAAKPDTRLARSQGEARGA